MKPGPGSLRVALIGLGKIARFHLAVLRDLPRVGFVTGCDTNPRQVDYARRTLSLNPVYSSLEALLDAERPQVAHILVPPPLHAPAALICLDQNCHCLIEKPLALSSSEVQAIAEHATCRKRTVAVNHNLVWTPAFQKLRSLIDSGYFGSILNVAVCHSLSHSLQRGHWATNGFTHPIFEAAPHPLSLIIDLLGPIRSLDSRLLETTCVNGCPTVSSWQTNFECEKGPATCFVSLQSGYGTSTVTVLGEDGKASVDLLRNTLTFSTKSRYSEPIDILFSTVSEGASMVRQGVANLASYGLGLFGSGGRGNPFVQGMYGGIGAFYRSILNEQTPSNFEAAAEVVRVCEMMSRQLEPTRYL